MGGKIITNTRVRLLEELSDKALILCDVTPHRFLQIADDRISGSFRNQLRSYRYGPGIFKID